ALQAFLRERLGFALQQRGAAVRNIRAVIGQRLLADIRPADLEQNLRELAGFAETESFRQLAEAFKRVRNIARELGDATVPANLRPALKEPAELALFEEIGK